jgi:glycosyltransferase involved in cell wall biosynthesis
VAAPHVVDERVGRERSSRHRDGVLLLARELDLGGSERQLCEMAWALDRDRFDVHVGCFRDGGVRAREIQARGIPLVRIPLQSFRSMTSLWSSVRVLRRYLEAQDIRIVHAFDMPTNLFSVIACRPLTRVAVLTSQRSFRQTLAPVYRASLKLTDRVTDGVVVNCGAIRDHLVAEESVPASSIHLCYNGLDTERFRRSSLAPPDVVPPGVIVVGTISVQRPEKSLTTLLDAFARCAPGSPALHLVIVGSGPQHAALQRHAAELGIASRCRFQPAVEDVVPWLSLMDVFVLPSRFEALSNALMEAMACECACVASRVGGNPELVRHEDTGLLFERESADDLARQLARLGRDAVLRRRLGRHAAAFIRTRFSLSRAASRLGDIYEQVLGARAS